jgi:hypothetical protein
VSRALATRLRKLEVKAGVDGDFAALTRRMTGHELFEHSKAVSEALVAHYGGVDEALAGVQADEGQAAADFVRLSLESATAPEFMGYADGWEWLVHRRLGALRPATEIRSGATPRSRGS